MTTADRARRLAAARPDAPVPCPRCAAGVKGASLERHLAKVHPPGSGGGADAARWSGPDRVGSRRLLVLGVLAAATAVALTVADGAPDDRVVLGAIAFLAVTMIVWSVRAEGAGR